jgi:ketosteroid isomerase-like protein
MSAELHNQDEQHLKQLEMSWDAAVLRRDVGSIADLVTDDYEVTDMNGRIHNKSTVLHAVASDPRMKPYRRDDVRVRIDGNTAVITGRIRWSHSDGNGNANGPFRATARYLKVYVKQADGWKARTARATRSAEK